jgi:hypothetical protein
VGVQFVPGNISIKLAAEDFSKGYQDKMLTDEDMYNFLVQSIYKTMITYHHRKGYTTGWCAALHGHDKPMVKADYRTTTQQQVQVTG